MLMRGHGGAVVTHSPPTSEVWGSNPGPYVGKLVVAYLMVGSLHKLYALVSSAHRTTHHHMTCTVFKVTLKPK